MSKLNATRVVPYDFRVFELDGWVWLYDESERTYICSAQPMIFAEPIYSLSDEDEMEVMGANYWSERTVTSAKNNVALKLDAREVAPDVPYEDAWASAIEETLGKSRS